MSSTAQSSTTSIKPFQYLEVRPCIQTTDGTEPDTVSFTDEEAFSRQAERRRANGEPIVTFWTIYGIDEDGRAHPVADDLSKDSAFNTMKALLGPIIGALEELDAGSVHNAKGEEMRERILLAAELLEDFVNQCSNEERI